MKPAKPPTQEPDGLFKTPLAWFIDMRHPLVWLADRINWEAFDGHMKADHRIAGDPGGSKLRG